MSVQEINKKFVFIIMPIGTGNDLSRYLNCGSKLNSIQLEWFIRNIIKEDLNVEPIDIWEIDVKNNVPCINNPKSKYKNYKTKNFSKLMILYMGIGYDANVVYIFEKIRKLYPLLMVSTKISRIYFAFIYFFLLFKSFFTKYLQNIHSLISIKNKNSDEILPSLNNMIFMNCTHRSGGMKNEWKKSKRASIRYQNNNILVKKDKKGNWNYQRNLYSNLSNAFN